MYEKLREKAIKIVKEKLANPNKDFLIIKIINDYNDLERKGKNDEKLVKNLEQIMKKYCKNLLFLAGPVIGARLIKEAGSLKKLAMSSSSKVQLLGAEGSFFKHLTTGSKSPKYGHIVKHKLVKNGKSARALADKIVIAARTDYFKGEFIADRLLEKLK
jgi:nucleolar protein 56